MNEQMSGRETKFLISWFIREHELDDVRWRGFFRSWNEKYWVSRYSTAKPLLFNFLIMKNMTRSWCVNRHLNETWSWIFIFIFTLLWWQPKRELVLRYFNSWGFLFVFTQCHFDPGHTFAIRKTDLSTNAMDVKRVIGFVSSGMRRMNLNSWADESWRAKWVIFNYHFGEQMR